MAAWGDDTVWQKLVTQLTESGDPHVKVGVLASKGGNETEDGVTLIEIAAFHEFGTSRVPERSFIRSTFAAQEKELEAITAKLSRALLTGQMKMPQALELLGAWGATAVKKQITDQDIPPPLAPATIARTGSTKPLVDTGRLLNSLSWEVKLK